MFVCNMAISKDHCNARHGIYVFIFAYTIDAFQQTYHHCSNLCKLVSSNNIKGEKNGSQMKNGSV